MTFDPKTVEVILEQLARSLFTAVEISACNCGQCSGGIRIWWRDGSGNWV